MANYRSTGYFVYSRTLPPRQQDTCIRTGIADQRIANPRCFLRSLQGYPSATGRETKTTPDVILAFDTTARSPWSPSAQRLELRAPPRVLAAAPRAPAPARAPAFLRKHDARPRQQSWSRPERGRAPEGQSREGAPGPCRRAHCPFLLPLYLCLICFKHTS